MYNIEKNIINNLENIKYKYKFSVLYLNLIQDKDKAVAYLENGYTETEFYVGKNKEEALKAMQVDLSIKVYLNKKL